MPFPQCYTNGVHLPSPVFAKEKWKSEFVFLFYFLCHFLFLHSLRPLFLEEKLQKSIIFLIGMEIPILWGGGVALCRNEFPLHKIKVSSMAKKINCFLQLFLEEELPHSLNVVSGPSVRKQNFFCSSMEMMLHNHATEKFSFFRVMCFFVVWFDAISSKKSCFL